jgi:hypothetical protein
LAAKRLEVGEEGLLEFAGELGQRLEDSLTRRMILSSTSVMFMTCRTSKPRKVRWRRTMSAKTNVRKFPMCAKSCTVGPQQ